MPEFPETSHSLIAKVKDLGNGAAWTEFLGIYQPVFFRMARRRGLQDADAQDVMQQVFLSISKSIEGWTPGDFQPPFRAWLTTIARNAITKALIRRPRDAATGSTSMVELLYAQPDPQETTAEILAEARKELIRWATEQIRSDFSEATWNAFWLTAIEGVPIAEVAKSTGRSAGAVYVARYRVIARLKEKVLEVSQFWDLQENES
jgi:RNA polymerase sigma-70 factor (ECF subfamily)